MLAETKFRCMALMTLIPYAAAQIVIQPNGYEQCNTYRKKLRTHSTLSQSLHCTRRAVRARVCNTDHRNRNDRIEDGRKHRYACQFNGENKGRSFGISTARVEQVWVVRGNIEAYEQQ